MHTSKLPRIRSGLQVVRRDEAGQASWVPEERTPSTRAQATGELLPRPVPSPNCSWTTTSSHVAIFPSCFAGTIIYGSAKSDFFVVEPLCLLA